MTLTELRLLLPLAEDPRLCRKLAGALEAAGEPGPALEALQRCAELQPENADLLVDVGLLVAPMAGPGEAARWFRRAVRVGPDNRDAHFNLGVALEQQAEREAALRAYRRCLELDPDDEEALHSVASLLQDLGRYQRSLRYATRLASVEPTAARGCNLRGIALRRLGRLRHAQQALADGLRREPTHWPSGYNLALVLLDLQDPESAETVLRRFEDAARADPDWHLALAECALAGRRAAAAAAAFRAATGLGRSDEQVWSGLGEAELGANHPRRALKAYERALAAGGTGSRTVNGYCLSLCGCGRVDEAIALWDALILAGDADAVSRANREEAFVRRQARAG
jgi:tetratricopeptide (TPR) repeat protein